MEKIRGYIGMHRLYIFIVLLYLALIALLTYVKIFVGSSNMQLVDGGLLVDGAWRILQGQIPHADFFTPISPLVFYITALGMKVDALVFNGIDVGMALFYLLFSVSSIFYLYSKGRWVCIIAPFVFGTYIISFSMLYYGGNFNWYVGGYNNIGFSLISLLIVGLFSSNVNPKLESFTWWGSGFLVALLLFTKVTFGLAGIGFLILRMADKGFKFDREIFITIASLLIFAVLLSVVFLRGDLASMISDFGVVASSRNGNVNFELFKRVFLATQTQIIFVLFLSIFPFLLASENNRINIFFRFMVFGLSLVLCGLLLGATIMQSADDLILHIPFSIVVISYILKNKGQGEIKYKGLITMATVSFVIISAIAVKGNLYQHFKVLNSFPVKRIAHNKDHLEYLKKEYGISIEKMVDVSLYGAEKHLGEGAVFIEGYTKVSDRLMVVDFASPLNFITGRLNPLNTPLFWQETVTFNREILKTNTMYSSEMIFSNVDYLLVSNGKSGHATTINVFMENYEEVINRKFSMLARGEYWTLYRHSRVENINPAINE
jgi:hypothetical protein